MTRRELETVDRARLTDAVAARLCQAGYRPDDARVTAEHLVLAEAEGYRSHGLRLVPVYLTEVQQQAVRPSARVELTSDQGGVLVFDAHHAPGHPALATVLDRCVQRARVHGVAVAWVSQLRHTGRLAHYVAQATDQGASAVLTVTSAVDQDSALVAPPGSGARLLGSNPLAIGVADGPDQAVYDGSTAAVPFYELLRRWEGGQRLDAPQVADASGRPSDDPEVFFHGGAIRPAGDARGFGLSIALALLAQLRGAYTTNGSTNAFALVLAPGSAGSLGRTIADLRAAGAYVPGSRTRQARHDPWVSAPPDTLRLLREAGVEVPCAT